MTVLVKAIHYVPPLLSPHKIALYYIKKKPNFKHVWCDYPFQCELEVL